MTSLDQHLFNSERGFTDSSSKLEARGGGGVNIRKLHDVEKCQTQLYVSMGSKRFGMI